MTQRILFYCRRRTQIINLHGFTLILLHEACWLTTVVIKLKYSRRYNKHAFNKKIVSLFFGQISFYTKMYILYNSSFKTPEFLL